VSDVHLSPQASGVRTTPPRRCLRTLLVTTSSNCLTLSSLVVSVGVGEEGWGRERRPILPDQDWYDRHVPSPWRRPARAIRDGDSPAQVADLAFRALPRALRETGGVPGLPEMVGVIDHCAMGLPVSEGFDQLREIRTRTGGSEWTRVAEEAGQSTIASNAGWFGRSTSDLRSELAERFVNLAVESCLFDSSRRAHLGTRFRSLAEARQWEHECLEQMASRAPGFIRSLLARPDAQKLRAPARLVKPEPTKVLLNQLLR